MTFKEKLVKLRKMKGLTQDDFASAVGVSRQAVYKWESGQSYPEVAKLIEIKMLLGISIDDLLDESYEVVVPEKKKRRRLSKEAQAQIEEAVREELGIEKETPAVVEAPVVRTPAAPKAKVAPVVEAPVVEKQKPAVKETPVVEEPVVEETVVVEEPVVEETPVVEAPVVEEETATVEETPVADDSKKKKTREESFLDKLPPEKRGLFSRLFKK